MAKYKYEGNRSPVNSTREIILQVDAHGKPIRTLVLGGDAQEITYTQYLQLRDSFVLVPVEETENKPEPNKPMPKVVKYQ